MNRHKGIIFEGDNEPGLDLIRVNPIPVNLTKNDEGAYNFNEFQRFYGHLFKNKLKRRPNRTETNNNNLRPRVDVKTIQLEMPTMDKKPTSATVKKNTVPKRNSAPKPVKKIDSDISVRRSASSEILKKLSRLDTSLSKDSKISLHHSVSTTIDMAKKGKDIVDRELKHVKQLLEQKPAEPVIKEEVKKPQRHSACNKKRLSNLAEMRKKLKELEAKVTNRPLGVYKNVKERCVKKSEDNDKDDIPDDEKEVLEQLAELDDMEELGTGTQTDIGDITEASYVSLPARFNDIDYNINEDLFKSRKNEVETSLNKSNKVKFKSPLTKPSGSSSRNIEKDKYKEIEDSLKYFDFSIGSDTKKLLEALNNQSKKSSNKTKTVTFKGDSESGDFLPSKKYNWVSSKERKTENIESKPVKSEDANRPKKSTFFEFESGDDFTSLIDQSSTCQFNDIKQEAIQDNLFCDELSTLVEADEDEEVELENTNLSGTGAKKSVFDDTNLQSSVLKSSYLMKEFDIRPKAFMENDFSPNRFKLYEMADKCKGSTGNNVNNMLETMEFALENSFYTVAE